MQRVDTIPWQGFGLPDSTLLPGPHTFANAEGRRFPVRPDRRMDGHNVQPDARGRQRRFEDQSRGERLCCAVRGMRERAAWGWRHAKIVTLVDDTSLRVYHVGKSGPYLVRVRGHNTLPASQLVA